MLTGKQKAQLLLSLLESESQDVLNLLTPESANLLMVGGVEDAPSKDPDTVQALVDEVVARVAELRVEEAGQETIEPPDEDDSHVTEDELEQEAEFGEESDSEEGSQEEVPTIQFKDPSDIANLLAEEKPQITAFVLSRVDDEFRSEVMIYLPEEVKEAVASKEVEPIPMTDKVSQVLMDSYLISN